MLCLVLDGELAELPFECLPHGKNSWIVDKYRISYVASSCDVLAKMSAARPSSPGCVVAAPDYDLGYIAPNDRVFEPLQGTLPEGEDVGKLLGVRPLTGPQATKPAVLAVSGPWVLHLATHGLFFDQRLPTPAVSVLPPGMTVTPFEEGTLFEEGSGLVLPTMSRFDWLQNYDESYGLPRSALALAGVNSWMLGGEPQDAGNGLLTQSDILGMDLVGTELVVLSACQTGRGRTVTAMEPLLGLRRAFLIAGARAVIASSWNVPDDATRYLMKMFYTRFVAGESIREALRNAQLDTKVLYGLPYYWGAFTCLGATSPWVE
jgi:CHAT domain-containing protein